MLKFLMFTLFLILLSYYGFWWLVHLGNFLLMFLFYFIYTSSFYFCNLSYFIGCDIISYSLILLKFFICSLMIMASEYMYFVGYYYNIFFVVLLFLMLLMSFSSNSFILFYLFFESSLIPTLFLIFDWGYQPEHLQAGMYFLFYTLFSSFPMLDCILYFYSFFGSLTFS